MNGSSFVHCNPINARLRRQHGRNKEPARQTFPKGPLETPDNKTELHMTFLPKFHEARQDLLALLIAIPVALMSTGFMFYVFFV